MDKRTSKDVMMLGITYGGRELWKPRKLPGLSFFWGCMAFLLAVKVKIKASALACNIAHCTDSKASG